MKKLWIAAYNLPTKSWTSGGTLADYDREHYDIFEAPASSHEAAVLAGRAMRQSHVRLTGSQKSLLAGLVRSIHPDAQSRKLAVLIEIEPSELRAASALARKGLLAAIDPATFQVQLSILAFNPSVLATLACEASS